MSEKLAKRLRHYRKINELEVKEVAEFLSKEVKPISEKSIYSWENGTTQPSADMFMSLCDLYKIDGVLNAFGYDVPDQPKHQETNQADLFPLTKKEEALIKAYREHPEYADAVHKIYNL